MRRLAFGVIASFALAAAALAQEDAVGVGKAPSNLSGAREQALAAALRDAVRKGAGVDVYSETKVNNFTLDYDSVLTASCGYVEEYKVSSQKVEDGFYVVEVKAKVGKGLPQMDKILALRNLVRRKGSPRVLVDCKQSVAGLDASSPALKTAMEELALKTGFEIVDAKTLGEASGRAAARDELLNRGKSAEARRAGVSAGYDFIIKAVATGSVGPLEEAYDMKTRDISLGLDMSAIWADTGETVASVSLDSATAHCKDFYDPVTMPDQLARKYLLKMLNGETPASKEKNAQTLFRRVVAKWITELDLGAKMKLEFAGIDKDSLDKLVAGLRATEGVAYVWVREFDAQLASTVEVESRLDSQQLRDAVLKILGTKFTLDKATKNSLQFVPAKSGLASVAASVLGGAEEAAPSGEPRRGSGLMAGTIIGGALLVVLAFVVALVAAVAIFLFKQRAARKKAAGGGEA